jgi:hypothetical protein
MLLMTPQRKIKLWKRVCPNCKRIHFVTDYKKIFCSDKCRKISERIRKKKPLKKKKVCRWCKKEFNPEEQDRDKRVCYCCDEHKTKANRVQSKEYQRRVKKMNAGVETDVKCYCLKCGNYHYRRMYYTGSCKVPYFFCEECSKENELLSGEEPAYCTGLDVVRMGLLF